MLSERKGLFTPQESPPAGNRKRCTVRGITCPNVTSPGGGGYHSPGRGGYPILIWPGPGNDFLLHGRGGDEY